MDCVDVIVIGGGSAGLAAALTLARALRRTLVLDSADTRNRAAAHSHGVLGFDGISPQEFSELAIREITHFGGDVQRETVTLATLQDGDFVVMTDAGRQIRARAILVATGVTDELPDVPGLAERWGREVVICPYCDGWENRGRRIGVLATGSKSINQAHLLRQWSEHVQFFSHDALQLSEGNRAQFRARGIDEVPGTVTSVESSDSGGVVLRVDGRSFECDVIFIAPRALPNDEILRQLGAETSPDDVLVTIDATGATSVRGLWAAGNVVAPSLKIPTAMGNGMDAATHLNEYLVRRDIDDAVTRSARAG